LGAHPEEKSSDGVCTGLIACPAAEEVAPAHRVVFLVLNCPLDVLGLRYNEWIIYVFGFEVC
jgi:hypothetical protein